MKKIVKSLVMSALVLTSVVGCGSGSSEANKTLKVFNVGEYIDMSLVESFEEEFDCKVIYETYDSNESMYTKLLGGNQYDIMVPSDYMISRLIKEDLIQKIDWNIITNKNLLDEAYLGQDFDKGNEYWVPYFCGNVGIVYDKTKVSQDDLNAGWDVLNNTKYKGNLYMYDSERDSFMIALKALGYSMNTTNEAEIKSAYEWLVNQRDTMNPTYATDDSIDAMKNGEKALCVMYSGDAAAVMSENEDLGYYMPQEGTNYWFDGFVISKDCNETELANQFINYMMSDENAYANACEVGYLTANKNAAKEAKENNFAGINAYALRIEKNDECFAYQSDEVRSIYSSYWTKVKAK